MPLSLHLLDDQYPNEGYDHTRLVSRLLILDEENRVAIHLIHRDDRFGNQTCYETPGGGVDEGETPEEAACREAKEEVGYEIKILAELGTVIDYYNLLKRRNEVHFFLARRKKEVGRCFASKGDLFIQKTIWVSLDEAIRLYQEQEDVLFAGLVKKRDLPMLLEAKKVLKNLD